MNHAILALVAADAAKDGKPVRRDIGRACGGCGAGPMESCDPTCPRAPRKRRHNVREALMLLVGLAAAGTAASAGMTLLGVVHW